MMSLARNKELWLLVKLPNKCAGNCWAFSAVSTVPGEMVTLSEQGL